MELNISVRRVQQVLQAAPYLRCRKMKAVPWMTERQFADQFDWVKNHISWNSECRNVIFSDENRSNLDGPDGLMYYWHDLRKRKLDINRRAFGGGSVMVCGAIFANGKSQLAIIEGNRTAESCIRSLEDFLLPLIPEGRRGTIVDQQDNVTIHTEHLTKCGYCIKTSRRLIGLLIVLIWTPIDNVGGLLARRVYANGRVFSTIDELRSCILTEWQKFRDWDNPKPYDEYAPAMFSQSWIIKVNVFDQQVVVPVFFWLRGAKSISHPKSILYEIIWLY